MTENRIGVQCLAVVSERNFRNELKTIPEEVSQEWRGHLLGELGHDLTQRQQVRAALGFLRTALILRRRAAADLAWRPVDAVLRSRTKSNLFVLIPTIAAALYVFRHEGTLGVVVSAEAIYAIGGVLYG